MSEAGSDNKAPEKRMSKDGFFPTPIYFTDLADAKELNEQLKKDIRAWRERDPQGTVRSNVAQAGAWHSSTDMHTRSEFNPLTLEIFEMVQGIYDDLGYDPDYEPVCDSMWANINPRHAYNRHHTHPHALWSGVYYVQTQEGANTISFDDPRPQTNIIAPATSEITDENAGQIHVTTRNGLLVLFPSWLQHQVPPNRSQLARISIAFNVMFSRFGETMRQPKWVGNIKPG